MEWAYPVASWHRPGTMDTGNPARQDDRVAKAADREQFGRSLQNGDQYRLKHVHGVVPLGLENRAGGVGVQGLFVA